MTDDGTGSRGTARVVQTDAGIVRLTDELVAGARSARQDGRSLQLCTPAGSRLSYPVELLFADGGGGQWVVPAGSAYRDGLTGAGLRRSGGRFVPDGRPPPEPDFGRPPAGGLEIQIITMHRPGHAAFGATAAAASAALLGIPPAGWGPTEPVGHPWSARALTEFCVDRLPDPSALVVVAGDGGRRLSGRLLVRPVGTAWEEQLRLAGPVVAALEPDAVNRLATGVAPLARSMLVAVHPTRTDALRPAGPTPPPVPLGLLAAVPESAAAPSAVPQPVRLIPLPDGRNAGWWRLDQGSAAPFEQLTAVLAYLAPDPASRSRG